MKAADVPAAVAALEALRAVASDLHTAIALLQAANEHERASALQLVLASVGIEAAELEAALSFGAEVRR